MNTSRPIPSPAQFVWAFKKIEHNITPTQRAILQTHFHCPGNKATARELAKLQGQPSYQFTNTNYGRLAKLICNELNIDPQRDFNFRDYVSLLVHAIHNEQPEAVLQIRPEVVRALSSLGWFSTAPEHDPFANKTALNEPADTVREAIVQSRIGQDRFRESLISLWGGCSVSGCEELPLLRASHIKPWRNSNDIERIDPFNGLLLLPNLDAAFDTGHIAFDDDGRILISPHLPEKSRVLLGISEELRMRRVHPENRGYLAHHRAHIFLNIK